MFKLESYITPIILNHVAKYVKNIRPEDSQVSLWEGEVAFQNLDLRLDVLEEELNLPFEFLSGHVHELSILVPWMSITSEPIKITINTIEFVLKLKDSNKDATGNPSPKKTEQKKRVSKVEDGTNQQQGYVPALVNKIINNIVINCHNIILKYVEEDIVVSMNIQLLSFSSADESWKPAFIDVHPLRVFLRKLIQVSDLTICLDKRNAAGQIEVCQEPILYRCSLETRIVRKYNANTLHLGSITQIAIFTKLMEMNVSSLQFPMAMRLFKLLLALKSGDLKSKTTSNVNDENNDHQESTDLSTSSYLNWAWNLIPSFGLSENEEQETDQEQISGQIMDIGIYIEALKCTLKSSELITDSIVGATKKIRYSPIVKVILLGLYSETVIISDKNWSNTKCGCSGIAIEPLDIYKDEDLNVTYIVTTPPLTANAFLDRSLFDSTFVEKDWNILTIEGYNARVTEDYLRYRSPALAFDLLQYKEDSGDEASTSKSDDNKIRTVYRILISNITFRHSQSYSRIAYVVQELIATYDYPPYIDKTDSIADLSKLHPPLMEDYDSLMAGIPLRVYKFNFRSINIDFHPKTESANVKPAKKLSLHFRKSLPYFKLSFDKIEAQWTTPLDPDKLVHTTCQLPDKPIELLNACYVNLQLKFKNISLQLKQKSDCLEILTIPKGVINYGDLLQKNLWKNEHVSLRKCDVLFETLIFEFSLNQLIIFLRMLNTIKKYNGKIIQQISKQSSTSEKESFKLRIRFKDFNMKLKKYSSTIICRGNLKQMDAFLVRPSDRTIILNKTQGNQRDKWLEWYVETPNDFACIGCSKSLMALWIEEYNINVETTLLEFLDFTELESIMTIKEYTEYAQEPTPSTPRAPVAKQSSKKSIPSEPPRPPRKLSYPEETIHVSSERDEKVKVETNRAEEKKETFSYRIIIAIIKNMLIRVEIAEGKVILASIPSEKYPEDENFTKFTLPKVLFSSASTEHIDRFNVQDELKNENITSRETFPWTCTISDLSVQSSLNNIIQEIIHPIQTSITIAMSHKRETRRTSKLDPTSPLVEESKEEKEKRPSNLSTLGSVFVNREPDVVLRRATASISANGSSQLSEECAVDANVWDSKKSFIQEAVEMVSAGRKSNIRDIVAISLHIDTSPIHVEFGSERIKLMLNHFTYLSKLLSFLKISQHTKTEKNPEIFILTNVEENSNIKQFLEMDSNSDASVNSSDKGDDSQFITSILLQWTITKFTAELDASKKSKCKLILDMEDLILSLDKREDFTKLSTKVGTFNVRFFELNKRNEFVISERLRIKMQSDSGVRAPLFNMVYTKVNVRDFFRRIGVKRKEPNVCRCISEVFITMEAIEMIFDLDKIEGLAPALKALRPKKQKDAPKPMQTSPIPFTTCQLPMVHFESRGFTMYIPKAKSKTNCSVAVFKIFSITISPNSKNPLQRSPTRSDVFQKAAQLGILGTPGSIVEDRQYELTLLNMSAATANWKEILPHMKSDSFQNTNPAFEWNNQSKKNSPEFNQIFSKFTIITTYAPCITFHNILICGQAIEFNCTNDLNASLTLDQLSLLSCIANKITNIHDLFQSPNRTKKKLRNSISEGSIGADLHKRNLKTTSSLQSFINGAASQPPILEDLFEKPITDSGFSSSQLLLLEKTTRDSSLGHIPKIERNIPQTISFVSGVFLLNLYNHSKAQNDEESKKLLLSIELTQPSFLISHSMYEVTKRFSLFNFVFLVYRYEKEEELEVVSELIFDTKRGVVGSSGIPPPLLVLNSHITKSKKHEIDFNLSKPSTIRLSEMFVKVLSQHMALIYETIINSCSTNLCDEKPVSRGTKIELIKNMFLNADRFNLKIDMVSLKFSENDKYNIKLSLADFRLSTRFLSRPEKMNIKGSIGGLYVRSKGKIILHPIGSKFNFDFVQEPWNRLPMITANMKFNVIQCDIEPEAIRNCLDTIQAYKSGIEAANSIWADSLKKKFEGSMHMSTDNLHKMDLPEFKPKKVPETNVEFYQDDLRAGAFQFMELNTDSVLPMPYQIQIIKKNYGIICWRYPQPRKMDKIHIFPVPMAVSNPICIKCRMEYFSEAHESFLHYCDFFLSETISSSIKLPDREITANIWRVVIQQSLVSVNRECFETIEEDEELRSVVSIGIDEILNSAKKETDFILHPKVLVGCMRIDTVFRPSIIPKLQILLNINELQLNLKNHQSLDSELPGLLKKYKMSEKNKPINQTFARIGFNKLRIHAAFHTLENYSIHSEVTFGIKCLDHGYLNLIPMIEPTDLTAYFRIHGAVESSIVADKLSVNMGPSILHNLICGKQNWESYFREKTRTMLISKFIIANRTNTNLSFGQHETIERIPLEAKECCKYSFNNDCCSQALTFYWFDGNVEHASSPFNVTLEFTSACDNVDSYVPIDDKFLVLRLRKTSATQYFILIKGQIELVSMVSESFLLEFYRDDKKTDARNIHLDEKSRATFLQPVMSDSNISIRLQFNDPKGKGKTGNIPLKSNKSYPWLVKIPVQGPEKFTSFWIRIIREPISLTNTDDNQPERILICIWPIFVIRSMLSCPLSGIEESTNSSFTIGPGGKSYVPSVPATHQTDHRITFKEDFESAPPFNLTLKAIDWNKFFWYDEKVWTVSKSLEELSKTHPVKWPMNDEEELRIQRTFMENINTTLLYKCFPSRGFSCTLCLEVAPWGTFINATGQTISVENSNSNISIEVSSNAIGMLPQIKSEFTIAISNGSSWSSSMPIVFDKIVDTSKRKCYKIDEKDSTDIVIFKNGEVFKFQLTFCTENERNIFVLKPKYVIANLSKQPLEVLPFCLDHKETTNRLRIESLTTSKTLDVEINTTADYSIGMCVDGFHDLNDKKCRRDYDSAFVFFVSIKTSKDSDMSIPITLMHPFNRKCFSVQQDESSIAFSASLIEKNGQFFLSVFDDTSPMLLISNQTDISIIVGQTKSSENSKVSDTIPEIDGKHFEWYQVSKPHSQMYYSPPTSYANFPDIDNYSCNLSLALYNENSSKKNTKWSKSIKTNVCMETFLHIPAHGDVKVVICNKHRIIRVSIFYIAQQLEFSVKDLRSRLLTPQPSDSQEIIHTNAQNIDSILKNDPLLRMKPTLASQCIHQSSDPSAMQIPPFKLLISANEINVKIFVDCKKADCFKKEIIALYVDDFILTYNNSKRNLNLQLTNLQIDNQLFSSGNYDFPVVLCSQELYKRFSISPTLPFTNRCPTVGRPTPMAEITIIFFDDELKVSSINCRLSPIRAYIEDTYLNEILDYLVECAPDNIVSQLNSSDFYLNLIKGEFLIPKDIAAKALCISEPMKLKNFRIESMNVLLSVHTCVRLYIALDHSPLLFSAYEREDILTLPLRFGHTIGMHYLSGALFGAGWVVGSLEMLGSPSGLARSFSLGLKDFVSMPVQGLLRGPWGFIVGVTQGSASLLRNVTAGTVNSVSKLAASVSRNLDQLTLDPEHIQRTEALRRCRPQGFAEGFTQGITGLGISILGAVGGIARHTLEARTTSQVVTGMGKGIVGALTKPISGAAELVALTGQGVLHSVGFNAMPQQRSPSVPKKISSMISEQKIWNVLSNNLKSVIEDDQILFYNDVTLVNDGKLYPGCVFLTSTIFFLFESKTNTFLFSNPTKVLEISLDANDKTLINVKVKQDEFEEHSSYKNERIMSFLQTSGQHIGMSITTESFDEILKKETQDGCSSFYLSEDMAQYLIDYLKIINLNNSYRQPATANQPEK